MSKRSFYTITEARKHIFELANEVQATGAHITLTDHGLPKMVMMSADEYESWMETFEVMRDFPNLKEDIALAEKEYKKGKLTSWDDFLKEEGLLRIRDSAESKYNANRLHPKANKSSKKRAKKA